MADKKMPGRFTIQFNLSDPQQKAVSDSLEKQGRRKTQFITNAVFHYLNCDRAAKADAVMIQPTSTVEAFMKMFEKAAAIGAERREGDEPMQQGSAEDAEADGAPKPNVGETDYSALADSMSQFDKI